jgi:hypothetical protein
MVKKTINDYHGSPYKGHSETSESRSDLTSKLDSKRSSASLDKHPLHVGSSNPTGIPVGAHKISDDFYSYDKDLYITAKGMSYLASGLDKDEGGLPMYDTGFSYKSAKAVDLSTLGRGGLWDKLHEGEGPAPGQTSKLASDQGQLAGNVLYWLTGYWRGDTNTWNAGVPVDKGLTARTSKTWWENYKGTNESGSGEGDFALGTFLDLLFAPSKQPEVGTADHRHRDSWHRHRYSNWFYKHADKTG